MNWATNMFKQMSKMAVDNSPIILTGVGVAGTITTAILTGKATIKATRLIDQKQEFLDLSKDPRDLTNKEVFLEVWPLFIPPVGVMTLTVVSIVGANRIGARRAAAMAAAYTISEKAFEEYRDKVVERMGQNKERAVRDEIAQDRIQANPVGKNEVLLTGRGDVLCYDPHSGRYFDSSMETIKKAQNDVNYTIIHHGSASLNDFYNELGLTGTKTGEEVGWNSDKLLEVSFSTNLSDDDRPCLSIDFYTIPVRNYFRVH